ncbi:MAG TPA: hypothetical protein DCR47_07150 [Cryomorphaceae bacterium]|jgi:hypothetical protein|nr:hypothetical protein [Cryomorphaceae bacterium]
MYTKLWVLLILICTIGCGSYNTSSRSQCLENANRIFQYDISGLMESDSSIKAVLLSKADDDSWVNVSVLYAEVWKEFGVNDAESSDTMIFRSPTVDGHYSYDYRVYQLIADWRIDEISRISPSSPWLGASSIFALRSQVKHGNTVIECFQFNDFYPGKIECHPTID